ncbi:hypothetical protein MHUMG1_04207 [Metarhizium humberi]|nr:hypothetical protein MHUMG1_04207 [Metarhizium humberi]
MTASMSRPHWLVPSLMIGSLICGIAFALGHHFFYASLDSRIVQSSTQQEWNIRIGTGMAFLVKAFLTAAVGFAYTQLLWTTLASRNSTLEGIDAMFGVATNAWDFLSLELWRKGLGLVAVASVLWALPIVAVFTPAALTVQPSSESNKTIHRLHLPTLNFSDPQTFSIWGGDGMAGYEAPSIAVSRLVSSVASQGSIIPMKAPYPNSSFSTSFHAPSLSCRPMGGGPEFHAAFDKLFLNLTEPNFGAGSTEKSFFSFVPQHPLVLRKNETDDWKLRTLLGLQAILDKAGSAMLATVDGLEDPRSPCWFYVGFPIVQGYANRTIQCGLYNSSYDVEWKFSNGQQTTTVRNMTRLNPVSRANADNKLMYYANGTPDVPYVAVMDALGALLMGWIQSSRFGVMWPSRTQILSTVLTQTYEMQHLRHSALKLVPIEPQSPHKTNLTMVEAMEQLVTNISLSLFSVGDFLPSDAEILVNGSARLTETISKTAKENLMNEATDETNGKTKVVCFLAADTMADSPEGNQYENLAWGQQ